ncbi:unnamed protein product [Tilletia laevis]|nr:hypothetical protein CF336_g4050 [Tilletia laevis]KAE8202713.1 hypothetical protein CF335_g3310 [Tilletia laevis]CAD6953588.1 unnamed protein product [Tilletia laevis]CAD6959071.1 unnamed protein product [Tilletia controversa]CAD6975342.1 unnamed protein product [Tilletia controversa]
MSTSNNPPRQRNTFPTILTALLLLLLASSSLSHTHAARISNNTAALPPLRHDPLGRMSYRTFQAGDTQGAEFNVSTYTVDTGLASRTRSPSGIYGWNFIWRGEAYDPSRPLMVWFGSSASRCNNVSDPGCILSKGLSEGWPKRIAAHSPYTRTLLTDAHLSILTIVSPLCYNTSTSSPLSNLCGSPVQMHALKHYRPDLVLGIMQIVKDQFGFDEGRVVGSGMSMGGRGILRLGTFWPLRAVSVTGANLETAQSRYMKTLPYTPWDSGEGCWTLKNPNVGGAACNNAVPATLPLAHRYGNTRVQIYASPGDTIANLTSEIRPTCDAINQASRSSSSSSAYTAPATSRKRGAPLARCTIKEIRGPSSSAQNGTTTSSSSSAPSSSSSSSSSSSASSSSSLGPSHGALMKYGYGEGDLNFLVGGYGGPVVSFKPNRG